MRATTYCVLGTTFALTFGLVAFGPAVTFAGRMSESVRAPQIMVDRTNKSDRLQGTSIVSKTVRQAPGQASTGGPRERLPEGCDPLVSPLAGAATAALTGRCMS